MTTHQPGSALAIRADQPGFDTAQVAALRQLGVSNAGEADLAVFFHYCQRTGLDPFARQIYMVARNTNTKDRAGNWHTETKFTIQTGIDGLRLVGRRAADARRETLEVTDTEWCGEDGVWRDVWLDTKPPAAARVAVIRNGGRFPAVALFREYAQSDRNGNLTRMWAEKGALMVAKCAEALAWRKAFPQDLSGLYTADEMAQSDEGHTPPPTVTARQVDKVIVDAEEVPARRGGANWQVRADNAESFAEVRALWREAHEAGAPADAIEYIFDRGNVLQAAEAVKPGAVVEGGDK